MENYRAPEEEKDPHLWAIAKKRANFKASFITYLVINAFLWVIWYLTSNGKMYGGVPWPVWPTLGWGIGIAFQYFGAYVYPRNNSTESEYEKLKRKQDNK